MVDSVSISITSAIVYGVSGGLFFLLIFLLVLIGLCNCNCDNYKCCKKKKRKNGSRVATSETTVPSSTIPKPGQNGRVNGSTVSINKNIDMVPSQSKQSLLDLRQQSEDSLFVITL